MKLFSDKYRIEKELGRGGMGIVYLAFDTVLERPVALKTISPAMGDTVTQQRFVREARSAGKLRHNNIVTIYDFGVEKEQLYLVMEYLEGEDLDQLIARKPAMDIKEKLNIIRQVCLGLAFAHDNGVIHRDIKPANIRVLKDGQVKIMDFGLAVIQSANISNLTITRDFVGTPNYMAPERIRREEATGLGDQFAVGLILYELLTYRRAFQGEAIGTVINLILNGEPLPPNREILANYPELELILETAIKKDPAQRYPGIGDMAKAIEGLMEKMKREAFFSTSILASENVETVVSEIPKKKSPAWLKGIAAAVLVGITLLVWGLFFKGKQTTPEASLKPEPGILIFNARPYAEVEMVIDVKTNEQVPIGTKPAFTPLRLELKPGQYKIVYTQPGFKESKKTRNVTIAAGEMKHERELPDNRFIDAAVEQYKVPAELFKVK